MKICLNEEDYEIEEDVYLDVIVSEKPTEPETEETETEKPETEESETTSDYKVEAVNIDTEISSMQEATE